MSTSHAVSESSNLAATATAATTTTTTPTTTVSPTPPPADNKISPTTTVSSEFNTVTEGKATILTPKADEVFYNPIQQFNRDLSIMAIQAYDQLRHEAHEATSNRNKKKKKLNGLKILESLSASGLRSCRYGLEIPEASRIVANDLLPEAVEQIKQNIEHNGLADKVVANQGDAIKFMASTDEKFHVVDLDPYGTAAPFIDSAIQCLEEDGMLLVTCTDAAVLAGSGYPEKCYALYGGNNFGNTQINNETNHEAGVRLILNLIASTAAKYKKSVEPVLCLSIDYYFRLFVKVRTSPIAVKNHASETMLVYGCNGCGDKLFQPLGNRKDNKFNYPKMVGSHSCKYCESSYNVAGPMYAGNLHLSAFIDKILEINAKADKEVYSTTERIRGMLTIAKNELEHPFYFNVNQLCSLFKCPPLSLQKFVNAIGNLDHKCSLTHYKPNTVKTDMPWIRVLAIFKQWREQEMGKDKELNTVGAKVIAYLQQHPEDDTNADFETESAESKKIHELRKVKMVRFQQNPRKNWGPQKRGK
ncbi:tRNA (guanine(26)-N(2))-dimethyltransferase, mitochondrial [Candida viswanathii]|uniref:tRNA (guanine(26)-N(2))-dimethyltransferase n=1 Tax=Candida viswanathii TaxID=5486 RepID=A0A367YBV0_9ASCO|nr:tRNA (guanine(26)-N(2))-dimethyltransferase, mitochondrial [Candida viswanathii]